MSDRCIHEDEGHRCKHAERQRAGAAAEMFGTSPGCVLVMGRNTLKAAETLCIVRELPSVGETDPDLIWTKLGASEALGKPGEKR